MMSALPMRLRRTPIDLLWQAAFTVDALARSSSMARRIAAWVSFWPLLLALRVVGKANAASKLRAGTLRRVSRPTR